jgi:hypothetical protein
MTAPLATIEMLRRLRQRLALAQPGGEGFVPWSPTLRALTLLEKRIVDTPLSVEEFDALAVEIEDMDKPKPRGPKKPGDPKKVRAKSYH